eukprot:353710-Chlamydomonas_euryale.AAC.4
MTAVCLACVHLQECQEEASMPRELAMTARPAGCVSYTTISSIGAPAMPSLLEVLCAMLLFLAVVCYAVISGTYMCHPRPRFWHIHVPSTPPFLAHACASHATVSGTYMCHPCHRFWHIHVPSTPPFLAHACAIHAPVSGRHAVSSAGLAIPGPLAGIPCHHPGLGQAWHKDVAQAWYRNVAQAWYRNVVQAWYRDVVQHGTGM